MRDVGGHPIHFGVRAMAGPVDRPCREPVAQAVELLRGAQQGHDIRVRAGALQRVPNLGAVALNVLGVFAERPFHSADDIEEIVDALWLWLRIPHEGRAQAPVLDARALGKIDETGELWRLRIARHSLQATDYADCRTRPRSAAKHNAMLTAPTAAIATNP